MSSGRYVLCLYWGGRFNNAIWTAMQSWSDPSDHCFWSGTGAGQNTNVMYGAGAMACRSGNECRTYHDLDCNGNYAYEYD
ncbi:hypothetical protein GCM10029978_064850 [Actinoallomurus acanthiterrae]